uniref:Glycosyltransferase 61 catalytic domain-containing protein n=1 Tax=Erythrolobus madagascarensis TaxID=708628 RepID=A0A7S0XN97_9RHOD|mmetsp:Transcript_3766/g.8297  ORF Transcript_3766/g.8297 Transcript_3766/m.8297 type:complete len:667 (+) Transcript_3766:14-2014(+)
MKDAGGDRHAGEDGNGEKTAGEQERGMRGVEEKKSGKSSTSRKMKRKVDRAASDELENGEGGDVVGESDVRDTRPRTKRDERGTAERRSTRRGSRTMAFLLVVLAALMLTGQVRSDVWRSIRSDGNLYFGGASSSRMRHTYMQHDGASGATVLSPVCLVPRGGRSRLRFRVVVPDDVPKTCATLNIHGPLAKIDTSTLLCDKYESAVLSSTALFGNVSSLWRRRANDAWATLETEPASKLKRMEDKGEVIWIEEDTLVMSLGATRREEPPHGVDRADRIQLYEQAAMISHIRNNPTMYRLPAGSPSGAIVMMRWQATVPSFSVSAAALARTNRTSAQIQNITNEDRFFRGFFAAALRPTAIDNTAPLDVAVGGIARVRADPDSAGFGVVLRELLSNHGMQKSTGGWRGRVCFRRAVLPSRLVERTMTYNNELWTIPSQSSSSESTWLEEAKTAQYFANTNQPPRDWVFFREQAFGMISVVPTVAVERKVVYMRRRGSREFRVKSEELLLTYLSGLAAKRAYDFEIVEFNRETFATIVRSVRSVAMLVGIHGHNLMPTYFMQPKTVVVEILPYRFTSKRYVEGVARRLKYVPIALSTGNDSSFRELEKFSGDRGRCMRESAECLERFRYDHSPLVLTSDDAEQVRSKLMRAFDYLRNTFFPDAVSDP